MKNIALIVFTVLFSLPGFSQDAPTKEFRKFKFGFKVDPNLSWMTPKGNDIINEGMSARASFGLNADLMFTENYAFGTGIYVMGNGGNLSYLDNENRDNDDTDYLVVRNRKYKLKYVEIPLTFKLRTQEIGYMTYWGQFGMGLSFMTNARADDDIKFAYSLNQTTGVWDISDKDQVMDLNTDISDDVIPVRASLIVGVGADYSLNGTTALSFGLTYDNGFTNVLKGSGIEQDDDGNPVFENVEGGGLTPKKFDLKSISNHFHLTVGVLF